MPKRAWAPFEGPAVRLRLLAEDDLATTLAWRNQDHIRSWFFNSQVIAPEQHRAWFRGYLERDDDFVFVIEDRASGRPVGQVALYHVDWAARRAEFGRLMIGEGDAQGRGFAREATTVLLDEAFGRLGLGEVYLEVRDNNASALRVYERCGFVTTGRRDGAVLMAVRQAAGGPAPEP